MLKVFKDKADFRVHVITLCIAVRSDAEKHTFYGARLNVLNVRLRSYHVLISYIVDCNGPTFYKKLTFLGQAGTFLFCQARHSSATHYSASDLTVSQALFSETDSCGTLSGNGDALSLQGTCKN